MFVPWMGAVTPLVLKSGAQFGEPGLPYTLTSKQYTNEFNEVKRMGGSVATGSDRTADQTATALFFSGNAQVQYTGALIDQADIRNMDIVDAARLFAAVNTSIADGLIAVWHAKLLYGFWRPITAINLADTDGNPDTLVNTSWLPLLTTPPYPDYVSGYSGVTGAFTRSLQKTLGTGQLDADARSTAPAARDAPLRQGRRPERSGHQRPDLLGIHFRSADVDRRSRWASTPRTRCSATPSCRSVAESLTNVMPCAKSIEHRRTLYRCASQSPVPPVPLRCELADRLRLEHDRPLGGGHAPGQRGRSALGVERPAERRTRLVWVSF